MCVCLCSSVLLVCLSLFVWFFSFFCVRPWNYNLVQFWTKICHVFKIPILSSGKAQWSDESPFQSKQWTKRKRISQWNREQHANCNGKLKAVKSKTAHCVCVCMCWNRMQSVTCQCAFVLFCFDFILFLSLLQNNAWIHRPCSTADGVIHEQTQ